jgi:hypothetical protein
MKNIFVLPSRQTPIKGDLLLRHIWKKHPQFECISWWRYKETITIENVVQCTTLNGSFRDVVSSFEAQNIYITNSETINTGDSYLHFGTTADGEAYINVCNCYNGTRMLEEACHRPNVLYTDGMFASDCKKIVLTTDRDLIKDRVQAIGDDFLGSFVDKANHSGKPIDVVEVKKTASIRPFGSLYVIEIPQQPKQETLEDFIKKAYLNRLEDCLEVDFEDGVRIGVKWEQQNSNINALDFEIDSLKREIKVLKHQQEKLCDSEVIQRIRATLSDAEARRIIRTI